MALYMIVERFKDAAEVYRRFRVSGRMMPEGLTYVSSWIDEGFERCFQLMQTDDRGQLDQWMANWSDLMEFEVYGVMPSSEAVAKITPRL